MSRNILPSLTLPRSELPQALYDELSAAVRGHVYRPSDAEFAERSKTFNGKLVCLSKVLVSPVDARDVSAIVRFCSKHGLSPSVKAGGYATAGWAVAGDVIIDLGMLRECDIEPPLADAEDGKDWTRLRDMPAPWNKGKGRAGGTSDKRDDVIGTLTVHGSTTTPSETTQLTTSSESATARTKRRREGSAHAEEQPLPKLQATQEKRNLLRSYDGASVSVASFLRSPPFPAEEGEEPRQPPVDKRKTHSPEPSSPHSELGTGQKGDVKHREPQVPDMSAASGLVHGSDSRLSTSQDDNNAATHLGGVRVTSASNMTQKGDDRQPFEYMSHSSAPRPPIFSNTNPFMSTSAASSSSNLHPAFPTGVGSWIASPSASLGAQGAWSADIAPSMFTPSLMSAPPFPIGMVPGSFTMPLDQMSLQGPLGGIAPAQPVHKHAYVTLGAGMRQKEVDMYTAEHPLEGFSGITGLREDGLVPYHIPSSAHPVGSSILILAGFGFISRMHGLSIDNLLEVEMVLADGRIVIVNEEDEPDLWWATRGAGPAFGIATRYKVRAYPVPIVFAGNLIYRFHRATAPSLIKHFRDCVKNAPRELYANVLLTAGPADKDSLVVIQMCYVGPKEKGMEYLNAISSWDGERCLLNEVSEKSYLKQQDSVAQILRGKAGRQWFIRSTLIHSLPDEVVNRTVIQFANTPIGCTWLFELTGGAIPDFEDNCLPKEQREAAWTVAALHQWEMGIDDPRCITSAEEWIDGTIGTVALGGPYPSFLGRHEPPSRTMACFGKNWPRLVELKRKYDPECLFKNNFWPLDKEGQAIELLSNEPPSP